MTAREDASRQAERRSERNAMLWDAAKAAMTGMVAGSQGLAITPEQFATQSIKLAEALLSEYEKRIAEKKP